MTDEDRRALKGSGKTTEAIAPYMLTIPAAQTFSGLSRSEIYRRLADGSIQAVKSGTRTLVLTESLRDYLASLPTATFRRPAQRAA
jgi:predicted DNA-binding transcriptional regulator AlpA